MAKRKPKPSADDGLFHPDAIAPPQVKHARRLQRLFIPYMLTKAAADLQLKDAAQDAACAAVLHWADLESDGKLALYKETSVDTQFLDQIFGIGLGYTLKTASPEAYHLEHKFPVPGVGTADAALGPFPGAPLAVVELKGAACDLDRDRSNGRTAVQQCWDYLNALPGCPWGIVSNFRSIRLYHRDRGTLSYEEFSLQELRRRARFDEFYCLFERGGLLPSKLHQIPRALQLLHATAARQKEVGDDLYKEYQLRRLELIEHLHKDLHKSLDESIRIAQKLLDRVIFIAFCEDRGLIEADTLKHTVEDTDRYSRAKNPAWENFLKLFHAIDKGVVTTKVEITPFNGGLFAEDAAIDKLELDNREWTNGFAAFGRYDFSEEVNVDVLGHIFERSITELEKLRVGGLFALKTVVETPEAPKPSKGTKPKTVAAVPAKMPKSAERKRFGIYYTPPAFTGLIVERTVDVYVQERFAVAAAANGENTLAHWQACRGELKTVTVCDPACGSGAFLIRAYEALYAHYQAVVSGLAAAGLPAADVAAFEASIPDCILKDNLFGVDLSREGVEITQLALWIRSARVGKSLADLSHNIVHGNSLVSDPAVDPHALDWPKAFPEVFARGGFTCVIGNPPWERVKVQDREFFAQTDPATAEAVSASDRRKRIAAMATVNPALHESYLKARENAQKLLDYARKSEQFPLTGQGDVNLYMLFAELGGKIVAPHGLVGVLVPSGIATDDTTKDFFRHLMDNSKLASLYDFENRNKVFEDVDGRFKFSAMVYGGADRSFEQADFVFFAHAVEETSASNKQRHITLTAADMVLLNPNTRTCPIFRSRRDAKLTKDIYKRVPILIDHNRKKGGNPWDITFFTMFHQTNDADNFVPGKEWTKQGYKLAGNVFVKGKKRALPLYEAKMAQAFDHRAASVIVDNGNWVRQGQKEESSLVQHQNPEFNATPRWWVDATVVDNAMESKPGNLPWLMGFKDISSPTNERTMISSMISRCAVTNKFVLALTTAKPRSQCCLLANFNAFAFDYVTRQKMGGITLNFFIVEQLPTLPPETYAAKCPWAKKETLEHWISERVLKLSCTAEDMIPLATACGFKGSRGDGIHIWNESERAELRAELDAAYFHLYGINRDDVEYILSTFTNTGHLAESGGFIPGGTGARILELYDQYADPSRSVK